MNVPTLPPGFELEQPAAPTATLPPLPPGFELEQPSPIQPKGEEGDASDWNTAPPAAGINQGAGINQPAIIPTPPAGDPAQRLLAPLPGVPEQKLGPSQIDPTYGIPAPGGFPLDNAAIQGAVRAHVDYELQQDQKRKALLAQDMQALNAKGNKFDAKDWSTIDTWRAMEPTLYDVYNEQDLNLVVQHDWKSRQIQSLQPALPNGRSPDAGGDLASWDIVQIGPGQVAVRRGLARQLGLPAPAGIPAQTDDELNARVPGRFQEQQKLQQQRLTAPQPEDAGWAPGEPTRGAKPQTAQQLQQNDQAQRSTPQYQQIKDLLHEGESIPGAPSWQDQAAAYLKQMQDGGAKVTDAGRASVLEAFRQAQADAVKSDPPELVREKAKAQQTFAQNFAAAFVRTWHGVGSGVVGTVAPGAARQMEQSAELTFGSAQPKSGGGVAGSAAGMLGLVLLGRGAGLGPKAIAGVFGAQAAGSTREQAAEARAQGAKISLPQEIGASVANGVITYAANYLTLSKLAPAAGGRINALLPMVVTAAKSLNVPMLATALRGMAVATGTQALASFGDGFFLGVAQNIVARAAALDPSRKPLDGAVEQGVQMALLGTGMTIAHGLGMVKEFGPTLDKIAQIHEQAGVDPATVKSAFDAAVNGREGKVGEVTLTPQDGETIRRIYEAMTGGAGERGRAQAKSKDVNDIPTSPPPEGPTPWDNVQPPKQLEVSDEGVRAPAEERPVEGGVPGGSEVPPVGEGVPGVVAQEGPPAGAQPGDVGEVKGEGAGEGPTPIWKPKEGYDLQAAQPLVDDGVNPATLDLHNIADGATSVVQGKEHAWEITKGTDESGRPVITHFAPAPVKQGEVVEPPRDSAMITKDGKQLRATVTTRELRGGGAAANVRSYEVSHVKLHDDATGSYEDVPIPPEAFQNFKSSADAREAIFKYLEEKYPPDVTPPARHTPAEVQQILEESGVPPEKASETVKRLEEQNAVTEGQQPSGDQLQHPRAGEGGPPAGAGGGDRNAGGGESTPAPAVQTPQRSGRLIDSQPPVGERSGIETIGEKMRDAGTRGWDYPTFARNFPKTAAALGEHGEAAWTQAMSEIPKRPAAPAAKSWHGLTLPAGWKEVVGQTSKEDGKPVEAEVDWPNKRIVYASKEHLANPTIRNHELGHVLIEHLPQDQRDELLKEWHEASGNAAKGHDLYWAHEGSAIDAGLYLDDRNSVSPELRAIFDKYLQPPGLKNQPPAPEKAGTIESKGPADVETAEASRPPGPGPARSDVPAGESRRAAQSPADRARIQAFRSGAVHGNDTAVALPGGKEIAARYAVVDADALTPSHDARANFAPNAIGDENERPYHDPIEGAESRRTVESIAARPRAELLHTDTPTATDGPPIVSAEGIVYGGNARAMAMQLAYHRGGGQAGTLKGATRRALSKFGIDPAAAAGIARPVIVRVVAGTYAPGELSRVLNEALTTGKTSATDAVSRAGKISDGTAERISTLLSPEGSEDPPSLREVLSQPKSAAQIVKDFVRDGVWSDNDVTRFTDSRTGALNDDGKAVIERSLLARIIDDPGVLASATAASRRDVLAALPELLRAIDVQPKVKKWLFDAIASHGDYRASGLSAEDFYFRQQTLQPAPGFGVRPVATLAGAFDRLGPRKFKAAAKVLLDKLGAADPDQQRLGFAVAGRAESPERAIQESFGAPPPDEATRLGGEDRGALPAPPAGGEPEKMPPAEVAAAQKRMDEITAQYKPKPPLIKQRMAVVDYRKGEWSKERIAVLVTGPPAAGKTAVVDPLAKKLGAYVADSDKHKQQLAGDLWEKGLGATAVNPDSADVNLRALELAARDGANVIVPILGRNQASLEKLATQLHQRGYTVHLVLMNVPPAVAAERAWRRFKGGGQGFIPPAFVQSTVGEWPKKVYDALREQAPAAIASFTALDNDVPRDQPPKLLERSGPAPAALGEVLRPGGKLQRGPVPGGRGGEIEREAPPPGQAPSPANEEEGLGSPATTLAAPPAPPEPDRLPPSASVAAVVKVPTHARIEVAPLPGGQPKRLDQIKLDFERALGKRLRVAKPAGGFRGTYFPGSTRTIIRYHGDLDVAGHEAAHFLDDRYGIVADWAAPKKRSPFDQELIPNFSGYGSVRKSGPRSNLWYQRAEGVAEWARAWMFNPDAAEAAAPQFTAWVKRKVPPEAIEAMRNFGDDVRKWAGQGPAQRQLSNIRMEQEKPGIYQSLTAPFRDQPWFTTQTWLDKQKVHWQDALWPVMKAIPEALGMRDDLGPLLPRDNPAMLVRLLAGFDRKFGGMLEHGLLDAHLERVTPGGVDWLAEPLDANTKASLKKDMADTASLMVSQRVVEKADINRRKVEEKIGELLTAAGVKDEADLKPDDPLVKRIQRLRDGVNARNSRLAGVGAGIYHDELQSRQAIDDLRKDPAAFARISEAASRYRTWADATLRYMVDKGRMSEKSYQQIKAENQQYVAMHRVMQEIETGTPPAKGPTRGTGGKSIGSADNPVQRFKGSTRTIENPYVNLLSQTYRIYREADRNEAMDKFTDLLRSDRKMYQGKPRDLDQIGSQGRSGDPDAVKIWHKGKLEYWQFEKGLHASMKQLGQMKDPAWFLNGAAKIVGLWRGGVTSQPGFAVRNLLRDLRDRAVVSEHGGTPLDLLQHFSAAERARFMAGGGGLFGHYGKSSDVYYRELGKRVKELAGDKSVVLMRTRQVARAWSSLMEESELRNRLAEYRRAHEHATQKLGYDQENATLYAAHEARRLMDFSVAGDYAAAVNRYLHPFFSARIRGSLRVLEAAKANPKRFGVKYLPWLVGPALAAWLWAHRDKEHAEEYRQLPAWRRDQFDNFKAGHLWVAVPRPFEMGVVAESVNRSLDRVGGDKHAFDGYLGDLLRNLAPADETAVGGPLSPFFEAMANYSLFYGSSIVPDFEKDKDLSLRDTSRASRLGQAMQWVSEKMGMGVDARKLDYLTHQFGGGLAQDVSDLGRTDRQPARFLSSGVGVAFMPPGQGARDVQAVQRLAKLLGQEETPRMKRLQTLVQYQQRASTLAERDERAKDVRDYAAGLRSYYEENYDSLLALSRLQTQRRLVKKQAG